MALEVPVINIAYKRGDSRLVTFTIKTSAGAVQDLTGYTAPVLSVHSIKNPPDVSTQVFKVTGTIPTPANGQVLFQPAEDNTGSDQEPAVYYYDAQFLDPTSRKITFVEGTFTITQDKAKD